MSSIPENPILGAPVDTVLDEMGILQEFAPYTRCIAREWLLHLRPHEVSCNCKDRKRFVYFLFCRFFSWMGA
jgi:hypothetical protein